MNACLVVPTRGESPWLAAALESARPLGSAWRVLLVCPPARADDLRRRFPAVAVVAEREPGLYAAINTGLAAAGDWAWGSYLNDDDLVTAALAVPPAAGTDILYGGVDYLDASGRRIGSFPVEARPARLPALLAAGVPALTPQGTVISRRIFETLGGFDVRRRYCGDFDFWLRAAEQGARFEHRPAPHGAFRIHAGQLSADTAAAAAELAAVCAPARARRPAPALAWARLAFRLRHLPEIIERRRLTGHWRSRSLFGAPPP